MWIVLWIWRLQAHLDLLRSILPPPPPQFYIRRFPATIILTPNPLRSSRSGLSPDSGFIPFRSRPLFFSSHPLIECRGVSSPSPRNLYDTANTWWRFQECFLSRQCPVLKLVILFRLILLSPMLALNLLKFQSLTKVLWAASVLLYPSTVLFAIIIFGYSLKNAPPRLQILVIPRGRCTLPHKLICLLDSLYTN